MKTSLPEALLARLNDFVATAMAITFPRSRWDELGSKVCSAAQEMGANNPAEFIEQLLSSSLGTEQLKILASHLTIGETFFWREPQVFSALETQILPALIRFHGSTDKRLRIWSAGCATGEEPYSIAMALHGILPASADWEIS